MNWPSTPTTSPIPNSFPLGELQNHLNDIPTSQPIVAVCHSGRRSGQATVILQKHGIKEVANLRGGMVAWQAAGLPIAQG
jgi:sulfur dioxygenase